MNNIEAFITKLYIKIFGKPDTVNYLSGKGRQTKESNNEDN